MKLNDFISDNNMSHTEFGKRIGVSQAAISRYANGSRWPKPEIVELIEAETNGQVTIQDHYAAYKAANPTSRTHLCFPDLRVSFRCRMVSRRGSTQV